MGMAIVILILGFLVYHLVIVSWLKERREKKQMEKLKSKLRSESRPKPRPWLHEKMDEARDGEGNTGSPVSSYTVLTPDILLREFRSRGITKDSMGRRIDFSSLDEEES